MSTTVENKDPSKKIFGIHDFIKVVVVLALLVALIAGLAGRWDWWAGWSFLLAFVFFSVVLTLWLAQRDPELVRERNEDGGGRAATWDKVITSIMVVLEIGILVVAALDAGRFGWSPVPLWVQVCGCLAMIPAAAIVPWVLTTNTFASSVARLQDDRGQVVISDGPYRYLRHPMYAAVSLIALTLPLVLGSWWALIPGGLLALLFVIRTALEDRMLRQELPGYKAYTHDVRYRLIPGLW